MLSDFKYITYVLFIAFILSCDKNPVKSEFYNDDSFYYFNGGKKTLYTSNSVMFIKFKDNTSLEKAKNLLKVYNLRIYSETYTYYDDISIDKLITHKNGFAIKIMNNFYQSKDYITKYPKIDYVSQRFGNLPEVEFCLPSYSTDGSQNDRKRVFILEEIIIQVISDTVKTNNILKEYYLEEIPKEFTRQNKTLCKITEHTQKDPLTTANEIYEKPSILFAHTNFVTFFDVE